MIKSKLIFLNSTPYHFYPSYEKDESLRITCANKV